MKQEIIYPKYLEAVKFAVERHHRVLEGKGRVKGSKFAQLIRQAYPKGDPMSEDAAELAEANIDNIELTPGGSVRWQFK